MNKRILKITALLLVFIMIVEIFPVNQLVYAEENEDEKILYLPVSVMQESEEGYIEGEYQLVEAKVVDGCVLVDINWLSTHLGLYMKSMTNGVGETCVYMRKPDSALAFKFVPGKDTAIAISKYFGTIEAKLGTNVLEDGERIWVPLIMFLNLFDSQIQNRGKIAYLYPCLDTVVDILHPLDTYSDETTAYSYLRQYEYDVVNDSHMEESMSTVQLSYIMFYRKLKNIFQGTVNFDVEKIKKALPSNTDDIAEALAIQLFTNSEAEIKNINNSVILALDTFSGISEGIGDSVEMIEDAADMDFTQALNNWIRMGDEIAESSEGFVSQSQVNSFMESVRADLQAEEAIKNDILNYSKGFDVVSNAGEVLFSAWLKNITLASEITAASDFNVSAMKKYIESYNELSSRSMHEDMIALWASKVDLYDSKVTNLIQNEEMRNQILSDVMNSMTSIVADEGVDQILSVEKFSKKLPFLSDVSKLLNAYKMVAIGWDFAEYKINQATGEIFDAMDAFSYAMYVASMENDSYACVNEFLLEYCDQGDMDESALEEYRKLQWAQLKSYYLTRQNILTFYEPMKQERDMSVITADEIQDSKELLEKMAILSSGILGVTQQGLTSAYEELKNTNSSIINALLKAGVVDIYTEHCVYKDSVFNEENKEWEEEEISVTYQIPKIIMQADNINVINKEIYDTLLPIIEESIEVIKEWGYPYESQGVSYSWALRGDILSLVILSREAPDYGGMDKYYVYNISLLTGEKVKNEEVISTTGLSEEDYYQKAREAMGSRFWQAFDKNSESFEYQSFVDMFNEQLKKTLSDQNIAESYPYINEKGELCIIAKMYAMADASYYWNDFNLIDFELLPHYQEEAQRVIHELRITEQEAYDMACQYWDYEDDAIEDDTAYEYEVYLVYDGIVEQMDGNHYYMFRLQWWVEENNRMSTVDMLYINAETGEYSYSIN